MMKTRSEAEVAFGRQVRSAWLAAGKSQQDVANAMTTVGWRLNSSQVAKTELSTRSVSVGEALALADVLGVPLTRLVAPEALSEQGRRQVELDAARRAATARLEAARRAVADAESDLAKIDTESRGLP